MFVNSNNTFKWNRYKTQAENIDTDCVNKNWQGALIFPVAPE